jgi:hypothetical protein
MNAVASLLMMVCWFWFHFQGNANAPEAFFRIGLLHRKSSFCLLDHLDVVGRLYSINEWKPKIHSAPLPREPGRAVALERVLVLTWPQFNDLFLIAPFQLKKEITNWTDTKYTSRYEQVSKIA